MARKLKIAGGIVLVAVALALVGLAVWYMFFKKDGYENPYAGKVAIFGNLTCNGGSKRVGIPGNYKCKPGTTDSGVPPNRLGIPTCHWNPECAKNFAYYYAKKTGRILSSPVPGNGIPKCPAGKVWDSSKNRCKVRGMFPLGNASAARAWTKDDKGRGLSCNKPCKRRGMCKMGTSSWNKGMCCEQPWSGRNGCTKPRSHPGV